MIVCDYRHVGDLIELSEECYGEDTVDYDFIFKLTHMPLVVLSDSGDSLVMFAPLEKGKFHMHLTSRAGGHDVAILLREAIEHVFSELKAEVVIGFVPSRRLRLLIGMGSRLRPTAEVNGEWLYVITKEDLRKVREGEWQQQQQ